MGQAAAFSCLRQACGAGNGAGDEFLPDKGLWGVLVGQAGKFLQSPATGSHSRQHSKEGQCGKSDNFVQPATSTHSTKHCERPGCGR